MQLKAVVILSFGTAIGVTLVIFACALPQYDTYWPIFVLFFYIFSLIPSLIIKQSIRDQQFLIRPPFLDASIFVTMGFLVSSFGLPILLKRLDAIKDGALILTIAGDVTFFLSMFGYFAFVDPDADALF